MANEVEISASITGLQGVLSEIEQLRQAIANLSNANPASFGGNNSGGVGGTYSAGQGNGDSNSVAQAPHANAGRPQPGLHIGGDRQAPSTDAATAGGPGNRYSNYTDEDGKLVARQNHDRSAMAASAISYAAAPFADLGSISHIANGLQQMGSAIMDAHKLHHTGNALMREMVEHQKTVANAVTGGGNTSTASGGTPGAGLATAAGAASNINPPSTGSSAVDNAMGSVVGGLAKVAMPLAIGYGVYAVGRGISRFADETAAYRDGGGLYQENLRRESLMYETNYGARDRAGYGEGQLESDYQKDLARLQRKTDDINTRYDDTGIGNSFRKAMNPVGFELERRRELEEVERERAVRNASQSVLIGDRELRSYGDYPDTELGNRAYDRTQRRRRALNEALGRNTIDDISGVRQFKVAELNRLGITEGEEAEIFGGGAAEMRKNPGMFGTSQSVNRLLDGRPDVGGQRYNVGEEYGRLAIKMLMEKDPRANDMWQFATGHGFKPTQSYETMVETITQNEGLAKIGTSRLAELTSARTSLEQLGGSREDIYANMNKESGMYGAQISDLEYKLKVHTRNKNWGAMAETTAQLQNVKRSQALAGQNTLNYGYQTTDLRAYLGESESNLGMGIALGTGTSAFNLSGVQATSENYLNIRMMNLQKKINDPNILANDEQRRQWKLELGGMQQQQLASRRSFMDTQFGEAGSTIGAFSAGLQREATIADIFGGAEERVQAGENSLKGLSANANLLQTRYDDMMSGRRPSSVTEQQNALAALTDALTRLTIATEKVANDRFAIPMEVSQMRGAIAKTYMSAGMTAGMGGLGVLEDFQQAAGQSTEEIAIADNAVADLRSRGYSENSKELANAKRLAGEKRLAAYQLGGNYASSPLSSDRLSDMSRASFELNILNTLPGAVGSRRSVQRDQMGLLTGAVEEINERERQQMATGLYTSSDRLAYQEQRQGYQMQQVGIYNDMSHGWQARLSSTMINTPGNFAGVAPGLAWRAAVGSGVRNPLFGMNASDLGEFAGGAGLFGSIAGNTATPAGMAVTAMTRGHGSSADKPTYVRIVGSEPTPQWRGNNPYATGSNGGKTPQQNPTPTFLNLN